MSELYGSEEGWREASFDSRREQKQADIKRTVDKLLANRAKGQAAQEKAMEDDYYQTALDFTHAMMGNVSFGYSRRYSQNYDKVFSEEKK